MRKAGQLLLVALLLFVGVAAVAACGSSSGTSTTPVPIATGATLKDVTLYVYPEFDNPLGLKNPAALVMLDGQVEGMTMPANISFLVPHDAALYAAGTGPRTQYVSSQQRDRKGSDTDGWDLLTFNINTNYFVLEYYAPIPTSADKSFSESFIPLYPVSGLTANIQEPLQSTNFGVANNIQPAKQENNVDDGFNNHKYEYNNLESRQKTTFSIAYIKSNPATSMELRGSVPPTPSVTSTPTPTKEGKIMQWPEPPPMTIDQNKQYVATIKTNYGDIVIQLLPKDAPVAVNNFVFLASQGYYDGVKFHRVVKGFVIQSGDPTGTGAGTPGYGFNDEKVTRDYVAGTLAMANSGPNTNGSQFFITLADLSSNLPKNYTIFGLVTSGFDVVQKIGNVPVQVNVNTGEASSPTVDVHIDTITIAEK